MRKPASRKAVKHVSIAGLKKKLWLVFSPFIRSQHANKNGMVSCVSCGVVKHWKQMHAGHFFEKSTCTLPGYFSEEGVNPQCPQCNLFKSGNKDNYALWLEREYGLGIIQKLDDQRKKTVDNEREWLNDKISYYKSRLNQLLTGS